MKYRNLALCTALTLAACGMHKDTETRVVSQDQITELFACMSANVCAFPVGIQKMPKSGDTFHYLTAQGSNGIVYTYFYSDHNRFGITMLDEKGQVFLLEDDNLDGRIDHYGGQAGNMPRPGKAAISIDDPDYPAMQRIYLQAMDAVEQMVPKKLRDAVARTPKGTVV